VPHGVLRHRGGRLPPPQVRLVGAWVRSRPLPRQARSPVSAS
jgi:hypothetical protein